MEIILCQLSVQMLFTAMLTNALHATLENGEEALNCIGMNRTVNILAFTMIDVKMIFKALTDWHILLGFIS